MTTKIIRVRDLTSLDISNLCTKHYKKYRTCFNCPLRIGKDNCFKNLDLDRAIEVEYDESK